MTDVLTPPHIRSAPPVRPVPVPERVRRNQPSPPATALTRPPVGTIPHLSPRRLATFAAVILSAALSQVTAACARFSDRIHELRCAIWAANAWMRLAATRRGRGHISQRAVGQIQDEIRQLLHDPTAELSLWLPAAQCYVTASGLASDDVTTTAGTHVQVINLGARPLASLTFPRRTGPVLRRLYTAVLTELSWTLEAAQLHAEAEACLEQLRIAQRQIAVAKAAERHRLERDLHDGVQQRLIGLAMRLAVAENTLEDPLAVTCLREVRAEATDVLAEVRDYARGIHPTAITEQGLGSALERVAQRLHLRPQLEDDSAPDLPTELVTAVFLSLSEALTNAARYSGVSGVVVRLQRERNVFTGEVSDDGHGGAEFVPGGGLAGIRQRIDALGGHIEVNSAANAGTLVRVVLPIGGLAGMAVGR